MLHKQIKNIPFILWIISLCNINNYKYILILILSLLFFYKGIFRDDALIVGNHSIHNYAPWQSDEYHQVDEYNYENNWFLTIYLPKYEINQRAMQDRKIPLWNPSNEGGLPYFANFESSYFYPLNLLLSYFGWYPLLNWIFLVKLFFAGFGCFILMNYLRIAKSISLIAALVFMFNGFHHVWLGFAHINSTLFLPWLLFYLIKILKKENYFDINGIIFSVLFSLMWLGGHPETSAYVSLGLFSYLSYLFI